VGKIVPVGVDVGSRLGVGERLGVGVEVGLIVGVGVEGAKVEVGTRGVFVAVGPVDVS